MTWTDVIGQEHVISVFQRLIATDRLPHAFLFHGPDGSGKKAASLALAQTLECERGGTSPCEACTPCRKVERMLHPDVRVLFPYPTDTDPHEVAERLQRMAEEPYASVDFVRRPSLDEPHRVSNRQALYTVGRVREELVHSMTYKPVEGRYKVAIVSDADAMNVQAANAFLKMLEEPPPQTIFILSTSHPESLLPTIASRCQRFRFDPLPQTIIEGALLRRAGVGEAQAAVVSRMADGSFGRALELLESETLVASRDQVVEFLRRSYALDVSRISEISEWMNALGREHVKAVLGLMLSWIRDLLLFREMGEEAPLVNVDQRDAIARFCSRLPDADLAGMANAVEEAIALVERYVRSDLLLPRLSFTFHHGMRGRPAGRLFTPLSE